MITSVLSELTGSNSSATHTGLPATRSVPNLSRSPSVLRALVLSELGHLDSSSPSDLHSRLLTRVNQELGGDGKSTVIFDLVERELKAVLLDRNELSSHRLQAGRILTRYEVTGDPTPLISILKDRTEDPQLRRFAAAAIRYLPDNRALEVLKAIRKDQDPLIRDIAAVSRAMSEREVREAMAGAVSKKSANWGLAIYEALSLGTSTTGGYVKNALEEISVSKLNSPLKREVFLKELAASLRGCVPKVPDPSRQKDILAYADALEQAERLHLERPFRLSPKVFTAIVADRTRPQLEERPTMFVGLSRADSQNALVVPSIEQLIRRHQQEGKSVRYYEFNSTSELADAVSDLGDRIAPNNHDRTFFFGMHGHRTYAVTGKGTGDEYRVGARDIESFRKRGLHNVVIPGSVVVLYSCWTGEMSNQVVPTQSPVYDPMKEYGPNLQTVFQIMFPGAIVLAPKGAAVGVSLIYGAETSNKPIAKFEYAHKQ